jgi:hypothetical protein
MASSKTRRHIDPARVRQCTSEKVAYPNYERALDAAELVMLKGMVRPGCHIIPYRCPLCGEWHVANKQIVPVSEMEAEL